MSEFSNYLENAILQQTLIPGTQTLNDPVQPYMALFIGSPGETGDINECTYSGYNRQPIDFSDPVGGQTKNNARVEFSATPASDSQASINITHIGIFNHSTDGQLLYYSELNNNKVLYPTDAIAFNKNAITITLD
jgi:hypothetical protein